MSGTISRIATSPIGVHIVEARRVYAEALSKLVSEHSRFAVRRVSDRWTHEVAGLSCDVLLLACTAPADDVVPAVAQIRKSGVTTPVVVLTDDARSGFVRRAVAAGVDGLVPLSAGSSDVIETLLKAAMGERPFPPSLLGEAMSARNPLNEREADILRLASRGMTSPDIARVVFMTRGTVRNYLSAAIRKIGASNRIEAAHVASSRGWI